MLLFEVLKLLTTCDFFENNCSRPLFPSGADGYGLCVFFFIEMV